MEKTKVIFRKWKNEIIALFPEELGDSNPETCSSYMRVGQHASADIEYILSESKNAKKHEYVSLIEELESMGYRLDILQKIKLNYYYNKRKAKRNRRYK